MEVETETLTQENSSQRVNSLNNSYNDSFFVDSSSTNNSIAASTSINSIANGSPSSSVPMNEDPYYYVATIYKGTVITHSVVGNFLSQDIKSLVVS